MYINRNNIKYYNELIRIVKILKLKLIKMYIIQ